MMVRFLIAALLILAPCGAASASSGQAGTSVTMSELAESARALRGEALVRAELLKAAPGAPSPAIEAFDPFATDLAAFAAGAGALSRAIAANDGPQDLQCIFKGVSADAAARLEALQSPARGAQRARAYLALAALLEDAQNIAAGAHGAVTAPAPCPAR